MAPLPAIALLEAYEGLPGNRRAESGWYRVEAAAPLAVEGQGRFFMPLRSFIINKEAN